MTIEEEIRGVLLAHIAAKGSEDPSGLTEEVAAYVGSKLRELGEGIKGEAIFQRYGITFNHVAAAVKRMCGGGNERPGSDRTPTMA